MAYIYKITNKINGNIYIGQTIQTLTQRWCNHVYAALTEGHKDYTCPLHNAIRKYGEENFEKIILEECSIEELNDREKYWIQYYNSYNNGYNATLGGDGHQKYDYVAIAEYFQNNDNSITKTCKHFHIYDQVVYTALQNAGIDYKNCKKSNKKEKYNKPILLVEKNIIFKKITDIDKYLNKSKTHGNIRRCLNGITEKAYGYHWKEIEDNGNLVYFRFTSES